MMQWLTFIGADTEARFYYIRRVLHDWPMASAQGILANLAAAMSLDSRILVDEVVLSETNVNPTVAMTDVALMLQWAGVERTRSDWDELVEGVIDANGNKRLEVESVHEYGKESHECIIVLKLR